jgi:hydrogenase nickel incorporation protein HypA/HybF
VHEFSLAQGLFSQVLQLAESHGAHNILTVRVEIGKMSGIVIDSFSFGFEILARQNSCTENAVLEITEIEPVQTCLGCGKIFSPDEHVSDRCPGCGSAKRTLTGGDDIVLTQVEME